MNTQMTENIFDSSSEPSGLEDQSAIQLQNEVSLQPASLLADQQLLQLHTQASQTANSHLKSKKSSRLSADAFDSGDGSSHLDQDYDSDVAAMQQSAGATQQQQSDDADQANVP